MKHWYEFEEQDITNILSGLSHTVNKLKSILDNKDYEALAGDVILLKNKILINNRHSRYEDISNLYPIIINQKESDK